VYVLRTGTLDDVLLTAAVNDDYLVSHLLQRCGIETCHSRILLVRRILASITIETKRREVNIACSALQAQHAFPLTTIFRSKVKTVMNFIVIE
jgi:hypothetical protein